MKFCQKHQIHLFSDEIYALSIWDNPEAKDKPQFTSALSIDLHGIIDPALVHVAWGMSKVGLWFPRSMSQLTHSRTLEPTVCVWAF